MISLALAAIAVALPGSTASAQGGGPAFAAAGTAGTLRVRITVTGEGRLPGKKSVYRAATWKARHTATLETRLVATDPTVDPSAQNQASMEDAAGAAGAAMDETGAMAVMEKWNDKIDACEDDACENRVRAQMMADPEFQRITGAMQPKGRGVLQKAQGVNLAPAVQHWAVDPLEQYPTTGSARADESGTILGGMDGAGNITTTWAGTMTLDHAPGGAPVEISINHAAGTYTLFLSGARFGVEMNDCGVAPTGPCNPGDRPNTKTIPLLGNQPPKGKDWASTLTVTGPLPAGGSASGKLAFVTNLGSWTDPTENMPLQVAIEWSFTPGS